MKNSLRKIVLVLVVCLGLGGCVAAVGNGGYHYRRRVTRWCHNGVCTRHVHYHYHN